MGLYDIVQAPPVKCECGLLVGNWQSKDGNCILDTVDFFNVVNFYTYCTCGRWYEYDRVGAGNDIKDYKLKVEPN